MSWKFFDSTGKLQTSGAGGGGGGAPTTAPYVTTAADAGLSAEKVLGTDVIKRGTAASKPASPDFEGQLYIETDGSRILWRGNASAGWDEIARGEAGIRLAQLAERNHSSLNGIGADDHHPRSHNHSNALDGSTLSPGTLNLPTATAPAQTADGQIVWDSDDDVMAVGDGVGRKTFGYQGSTAPADVTKAAASAGSGNEMARANHKHDVSTAAPVNVTKAAGAEGTATSLARSDHKHDITTAAASDLANANAEGTATSLARSDHAHKRTIRVAKAGTDVGTRNRLNLIEGTNVTITVADDAGNDEVDVTIAASGGGGGGVTVQDRDVVEAEVVNTTTETAVYSYSVPGGTLGSNGHLRLTLIGDFLNNSGGTQTFTVRVKYGATTLFAIWNEAVGNNASRKPVRLEVDLIAANATNAQRATGRFNMLQAASGSDGATPSDRFSGHTSLAVDSTTAQTLQVTVQHAAANANLSFKCMTAILEKL